ncbi:FAD-binding oxidoreductase [Nocardia niigatensis]|uniref:FAD-binding oxidoreductase n=1 Tax=Nocardia niigatensis TaxID=209249 RepID=UPI000311FFB4|nr:FAD-binding oxidoreductase [Nocardia niigatensis]
MSSVFDPPAPTGTRPQPMTSAALAERLRAAVAGDVHTPGEEGYRLSAAGFNVATEHRAAAIVVATSAADVAAAVSAATATGYTIAVQATGHGATPTPPDSVLIDTALLDAVSIDPDQRTATVGAGVRWQQVLDAATPFGLAALAGSSTGVGVVGYTLGGGLGPIARTYGFAADHVTAMEVVTADATLRRVTPENEPELFRALLGGGAAFGIVTQMTFRLFPIRTLYGGGLTFRFEDAATVLRAWRNWMSTVPETVTSSVAILHLPPLPEIPEPLRGATVLHLRYAHVGDPAEGAALLAPMRPVAAPLLDTVAEMPYAAIASIHNDPVDPMPATDRSTLLSELPDAAIDALLATAGPAGGLPITMAEVRALGGALEREPLSPTTVAGRQAAFNLLTVGVLAPPIAAAVPAALEAVIDALSPWSLEAATPNFARDPHGRASAETMAAWTAAQRDRLVEAHRRYDPTGVFSPAARWTAPGQ